MGRSKGKHLRRIALELMKKMDFSEDLQKNKDSLNELKLLQESKKEFNKLAGELTTIVKQLKNETREKEARNFVQPAQAYHAAPQRA